jgi:hypothetical protein
MRVTGRRATAVTVMAGLALVGFGPAASAQDDGANDAGVPASNPGAYDQESAEVEFDRLVANVMPTADTSDSSSLSGPCGGFAYSYDGDGVLIDAAIDLGDDGPPIDVFGGGQAFTSDNPFLLDAAGQIVHFGFAPRSGDGPQNHTYSVQVAGITVADGGDPNPNLKNRNAGVVDLDDELPFPFSARVQAGARMDSENLEPCIGDGYVELRGDGLVGPVGLASLGLLAVGLVGLVFHARPARTWKV